MSIVRARQGGVKARRGGARAAAQLRRAGFWPSLLTRGRDHRPRRGRRPRARRRPRAGGRLRRRARRAGSVDHGAGRALPRDGKAARAFAHERGEPGRLEDDGLQPSGPAGADPARGVRRLQQLPRRRRDGRRRRDRSLHAAAGGAVAALPRHGGRPPGPPDPDRPPHLRRSAPGRRQAERPDDGGPGGARDAPRRGVPLLSRPADRPRGDPRDHRGRAGQRHDGGRAVLRRAALHRPGGAQSRGDRDLPGRAARRRRGRCPASR